MNITTVVGVLGTILAVIVAAFLEGSDLETFINVPAFILIFGGTFFATMITVGMTEIKLIPTYLKLAFLQKGEHKTLIEEFQQIVTYAEKARREGLLSLEDTVREMEPGISRQILGSIIDGADPGIITKVMNSEIAAMEERHKKGAEFFATAGGFAPTMGIIGTVMGVMHVLANLGKGGMEELGHGVAVAFVATFYGIAVANMLLLPLGQKLKYNSEEELFRMKAAFEGFLGLLQGENPHVVQTRLNAFLESGNRPTKE